MSVMVSLREINEQTTTHFDIAPELSLFIQSSEWVKPIQELFLKFLSSHHDHAQRLNMLFSSTDLLAQCVPIITYNEVLESFIIIYSDKTTTPPEPGEPGSVLSYFRSYGYTEKVLCSDCYGQLSCSSCAIEIHNGTPENKVPREEEYDMLDIDNDKPATSFTRLSCQTIVGSTPLLLTIRKPVS